MEDQLTLPGPDNLENARREQRAIVKPERRGVGGKLWGMGDAMASSILYHMSTMQSIRLIVDNDYVQCKTTSTTSTSSDSIRHKYTHRLSLIHI